MDFKAEHIGLASKDPTRLAVWYAKVFGCTVVFKDETVPAFFLRFSCGNMIEIYPQTATNPQTPLHNGMAGWRHLALRVDVLEDAIAHLKKHSVAVHNEIKPAGGGGRIIFFTDPEGNLLHLVERPAAWPARNK